MPIALDAAEKLKDVDGVSLGEDASVVATDVDETGVEIAVAELEMSELAVEVAESAIEDGVLDAVVEVEDTTRVSTATAIECQLTCTAIDPDRTHHRRCHSNLTRCSYPSDSIGRRAGHQQKMRRHTHRCLHRLVYKHGDWQHTCLSDHLHSSLPRRTG